jgi:putative ABC transport system ATP-binding protein
VNVVDVVDLKKAFRSPDGEENVVLEIPSFSMSLGEHTALRGTSGSGKTTFLHILAGILKPDSGRVVVAGTEMNALGEAARDRLRARALGYVFQSFNLLQGYTALENVMLGMMFGKGVDAARARALLERVDLGRRMDYRPAQLSIGQQQRVAVARALANRPALVLADEPTGNLDAYHAAEALGLIRDVCREEQAALLVVSHDPAVLGAFTRVDDLALLNRASRSRPEPAAVLG